MTKPGVTHGGSTGSIRAEGCACAACSQPQQGGGGRELMRLSQSACSELMDTSQSMLLLVRIRGYVSTSSKDYLNFNRPAAVHVDPQRI